MAQYILSVLMTVALLIAGGSADTGTLSQAVQQKLADRVGKVEVYFLPPDYQVPLIREETTSSDQKADSSAEGGLESEGEKSSFVPPPPPKPSEDGTVEGTILARFTDLYIKPILFERAELVMQKVRVVPDEERPLRSMGRVVWQLEVSQERIEQGFKERVKKAGVSKVEITPEGLSLSGRLKLGFLSIPYRLKGKLVSSEEGRLVIFDATEVRLLGMGTPEVVEQKVEERLNPIIDFDERLKEEEQDLRVLEEGTGRKLRPRVRKIELGDGEISFTGEG